MRRRSTRKLTSIITHVKYRGSKSLNQLTQRIRHGILGTRGSAQQPMPIRCGGYCVCGVPLC